MIKKTAKSVAKRTLHGTKKAVIKVPVLRHAAVRAKAVLFPGLSDQNREIYHYHNYYPSIEDYVRQQKKSTGFAIQPLISIVVPTYNTPDKYLRECLDSVLLQSYPKWELCIADDNSPDETVVETLKEYAQKDERIKYVKRKTNGHISEASNSAIELATGDFIGLLDHDDVLWPNALYEIVSALNANPKADLIYTDEDKINSAGDTHSYPFLKPDWSPEFLESCNYITHFTCIRTSLIKEIGGFRKGTEGAQDWDLFIRVGEKTSNIIHIPKIVYSWRIHEASTAANTDAKPYVYEAQAKLLTDYLKRTGRKGDIETGIITQHRTIKYAIGGKDMLSVVVTSTRVDATKRLLHSMSSNEAGAPIEIIVLSQGELDATYKAQLQAISPETKSVFIVQEPGQGTYETALQEASGNYLLFVSDQVEITSPKWAKISIGDAQLAGVGLVGPVLLDPSKQIIVSAGVGLGYGPDGALDMLRGTPFEDPHYTRGLYAKSRRNVSAVNDAVYAVSKAVLQKSIDQYGQAENAIELSTHLLKEGYRQVYTPYIQAIVYGELPHPQFENLEHKDIYLNPNFNRHNQRMEVR